MPSYLHYNDEHMWAPKVAGGVTKQEWKDIQKALGQAHKELERIHLKKEQGFFDLPFETKTIALVEKHARVVRKKFDQLIVIGIGGSDLGARAIWQSIAGDGVKLHFVSNPDPEVIATYVHAWKKEWKRTAINVVSKSGTTLETMAVFMTLREAMIKTVGERAHASQIYVTTEEGRGALFEIAQKYGYTVIPHPLNVGGRFSVLSAVALFPAACGGVNIRGLLKGAASIETARRKEKAKHMSATFAALHYLAYIKHDKRMHVLMPYASRLFEVAFWYRQLWGESLGKKRMSENVGPTPIAAFGVIDQHSQIQLYNEGPNDKVLTFIEVEKFKPDLSVPKVWQDVKAVDYIGGQSFTDIMHAERIGTANALAANGRPNGTLTIPSISAESVGALFHFYECATAYMGALLDINTFDQPGVEEGKKRARAILSTHV